MIHELKILPEFFYPVSIGLKTFELRKNDRNFQVGDIIKLKEWNGNNYTGCQLDRKIIYILKEVAGLEAEYCILGIEEGKMIVDDPELTFVEEIESRMCKGCPKREQSDGNMRSRIILSNKIRHICEVCETNPLISSVVRYLLDGSRLYKELEEHTADIATIMTLPNVLEQLEFKEYIQYGEGLWSITQKGIDHFFRLEADQ